MVKGQMGALTRLRASNRRSRIATLVGLAALVVAMALLGGLPALAGAGSPSGAGVQPTEIEYGGSFGACDLNSPGLPSAAQHELWIPNPIDGVFTGPDGTQVSIDVTGQMFDFEILAPNVVAFDLIVKGGSQNTHYDYDGGPGPIGSDTGLHAPTKGGSGNLYALSQINLCYDTFVASVSGTKFHDRDVDGAFDVTEEEGLGGWTIAVFDQNGTKVQETTTAADGSYQLTNLAAGDIVCEATNTDNLPETGSEDPWVWAWEQSAPVNTLCAGKTGYEDGGYEVTVDSPLLTNADFGNHTEVQIDCSGPDPVSVTLGGEGTLDNPLATITVPGECSSPGGIFSTTYDVGRSVIGPDPDEWSQFVIVGGDPEGTEIIELLVEWDSELAVYEEGQLVVPTTRVVFDGTNPDPLPPAVLCNTLLGDVPNPETSTCLYSRTIAEGGDVPEGDIQLTELFKFVGDPKSYR